MKRSSFVISAISTALGIQLVRARAVAQRLVAAPLPQRLVEAFDAAFNGPHRGFRANHAKGFMCSGDFVPSAAAAAICVAAHFKHPTKVTVRFSDFGGYPKVADNSEGASPYGMAVKFHLADGSFTDIVGHSVPLFPTATAEEFTSFLAALRGGRKTMEPYLASHPKAVAFVKSLRASPVSFATLSFFFINAFRFVDRVGVRRSVRYEMRPHEAIAYLDSAVAKAKNGDYLRNEMNARLKVGPVRFDYIAHIAAPTDITSDPTSYWPSEREQVNLGTLSVRAVLPDSDAAQKKALFDPSQLPAGIELSDDPMVTVRSQSYGISFARRASARE